MERLNDGQTSVLFKLTHKFNKWPLHENSKTIEKTTKNKTHKKNNTKTLKFSWKSKYVRRINKIMK